MYHLSTSDFLLLFYLFVAKILPALVTYFADKYFNIKIKFKSLSVLNANVQNISIKWTSYEITVGEVSLRTKFLNGDYKKPFCVDFEDVKVCRCKISGLDIQQQHHRQRDISTVGNTRKAPTWAVKLVHYIKHFLPPIVMATLQFLQIRVKNFSTTISNHQNGPMMTISIPFIELLFEEYVERRKRALLIALALQHIKSEFIEYNRQNPSRRPPQKCLAETVLDVSLESEVIWEERRLVFEKQHVSIGNVGVTFQGGLFDMIEHAMLHAKSSSSSNEETSATRNRQLTSNIKRPPQMEELMEKLAPKTTSLRVEQIEVKSLDDESSFHYHLLLYSIDGSVSLRGRQSAKVAVSNLRIYTPAHEVLHLREASVDSQWSESVVRTSVKLDTIDAVYNQEDIYGWFLKIFTRSMKSSRRELILKAIEMGQQKMIEFYHSQLVRDIFSRVVLNCCVEIRNMALVLELDDQISSINVVRVRVQLSQSHELLRDVPYENYTMNLIFRNRHWHVEVESESSLCWYMGSRCPSNKSKCTFVRGSALYLGSFVARIGSNQQDDFKVNLRANTLRVEYSNKVTQFAVEAAKSFKAFVTLFTQLKTKKEDEIEAADDTQSSEPRELLLNRFTINLIVDDISCFFINRHDVCTFLSLSKLSSNDNFNYHLDALAVSSIDFRKFDSPDDIDENSTTYISTCLLKLRLEISEQTQLCIDFADKLECSWNAHFLRHSLSLVRDFRRFRSRIEEALEIRRESTALLPRSLPLGLDIKKLRNIRVKHADVNVDKLILLINELSGENLFFYNYFH